MAGPERIDFLLYYRKQLQQIIKKLDSQIKKEVDSDKKPSEEKEENGKDLTDKEFIQSYLTIPGLADGFDEFREFLNSVSEDEESGNEVLHYSSEKFGKRFAMVAVSPKRLNVYFAPRLGLYENLPQEAWRELRFGKSMGDRWDKFQITSMRQAKMAIGYLRTHLLPDTGNDEKAENTEGKQES